MSEENVALVRATVDAVNRGDLEWLVEQVDDEFVFDWSRSMGPLSGIYRGRDAFREFLRDQWDSFETFEIKPHEFIEVGPHVVVPNTVHAQGRGGIEVSARVTHVFTVEGGRTVRVVMYQELDEALAAVAE